MHTATPRASLSAPSPCSAYIRTTSFQDGRSNAATARANAVGPRSRPIARAASASTETYMYYIDSPIGTIVRPVPGERKRLVVQHRVKRLALRTTKERVFYRVGHTVLAFPYSGEASMHADYACVKAPCCDADGIAPYATIMLATRPGRARGCGEAGAERSHPQHTLRRPTIRRIERSYFAVSSRG